MPTTTPNLGLQSVVGTDPPSEYRLTQTANNAILDNAATTTSGAASVRPASSTPNNQFLATDTQQFSIYAGALWHPVNLAWRIINGSNTANPGDLINHAATGTITLPTAANGALVGIWCNAGVLSTIAAQGGSNIYGVGCFNKSSIQLGTPGAHVALQADSAGNWLIISGQQDSGWQALSLAGGVSAIAGDYGPAARLVGDMVQLRGSLGDANSGGPGYMQSATLPNGMFPSGTLNFLPLLALGSFQLTAAGALMTYHAGSTSSAELNGLSYSIG